MDRLSVAYAEQRAKQIVRSAVGELYVGKRLKLRRLNRVMPRLAIEPHTILDAGAEDATFVYWLADRYPKATVTAVDIDEAAIAACVRARPGRYHHRVNFLASTFATLPTEAYDLITAFDVLEHIVDDNAAIRDLSRALRPGGTLLVHVPRDQWTTRSGVVHQVPDAEAWKINPGHVRQGYSPEALRALAEGANLVIDDLQLWLARWGVLAHSVYERLEHPAALRLLTLPITDFCAYLDRGRPASEGNTVFMRATKRRKSEASTLPL